MPVTVSPSSWTVICAITGRCVWARTASSATVSSSSEVNVSSTIRSTPRPSSTAAWRPYSPAPLELVPPTTSTDVPSGPIEPAISTSRPATSRASRAIFAPAALISST